MKKLSFILIISAALLLCSCSVEHNPPAWESYVSEWNAYTDNWYSFRGSEKNLAVTNTETPKSAQDIELNWSFSTVSRPAGLILVNGCIITTSKDTIYKIDAANGKCIFSAQMGGTAEYSSVSPSYADGVVYTALDGGIIQAFDYETFEPIWIYKNTLGGQALCPIVLTESFICTGFWNSEIESADFVCIDLAGNELMTHTNKGGFYLAGAVFTGEYLIVPSDNGETPANNTTESFVTVFDTNNWEITDSLSLPGDIRSSVVYLDGRIYVTSKSGTFCSAAFDSGKFSDIKTLELGGECTAPPVIYDGYAFTGTSARKILMIDLNEWTIVSSADTYGYPQAAMLLSDAYVTDDGCVYIYASQNALPGGIMLIKANIFTEEMSSDELWNADGFEQFCLSAPITDNNGALYYANDSGNIFSLVKK